MPSTDSKVRITFWTAPADRLSDWFNARQPALGNRPPAEALQAGETGRVLSLLCQEFPVMVAEIKFLSD